MSTDRKRKADGEGRASSKPRKQSKDAKAEELEAQVKKLGGPAYSDYTLCDDAVDAVSQDRIWDVDEKGNRVASSEVDYLFSWEEKVGRRKFTRGVSAASFARMLAQGSVAHPVSGIKVSDEDLARAREMIRLLEAAGKLEPPCDDLANVKDPSELDEKSMKHFATSVCQLFSQSSIYIDESCFLNLTHAQLATLISELKDMFAQNFSDCQRADFGEVPFSKPPASVRGLQHYVLRETQRIVKAAPGNMRNLVLYVLIGGLAVVSAQVRERYLDGLSHNFNLP